MQQTSLISQRTIYDHVTATKQDVHNFIIANELMKSCKLVHSRYVRYLDENKRKLFLLRQLKKGKLITEEINGAKMRKKDIQSCIIILNKEIERFSIQAEESNSMDLLAKANPFR